MLSHTVSDRQVAQDTVQSYLAQQYPELAGRELSLLSLRDSWMVQVLDGADDSYDGPPLTMVLLVRSDNTVEEVGSSMSRSAAHRNLQSVNLTQPSSLRDQPALTDSGVFASH